ncbi:MAG: hypothetical protein KAQ92_07960, partial [Candidatus Aenigmarchaeota archaeon]|nr:hypothetical protein [Candidatus Aenigmarchaeota archaeon]
MWEKIHVSSPVPSVQSTEKLDSLPTIPIVGTAVILKYLGDIATVNVCDVLLMFPTVSFAHRISVDCPSV